MVNGVLTLCFVFAIILVVDARECRSVDTITNGSERSMEFETLIHHGQLCDSVSLNPRSCLSEVSLPPAPLQSYPARAPNPRGWLQEASRGQLPASTYEPSHLPARAQAKSNDHQASPREDEVAF